MTTKLLVLSKRQFSAYHRSLFDSSLICQMRPSTWAGLSTVRYVDPLSTPSSSSCKWLLARRLFGSKLVLFM
ncbi:unnamed protein product [Nippostrongylus brasiliensis]|uniref:Uncharacterized protein n=1 Tax=Nippostrongylus brasiliensis TaxID=27835 RepID=A0A0N4YG78_NIPBR|nr:unnamed protein product [Nippostrongylus brasiliensis]